MGKWEMVRLGDVATYVNGYAFKPSDWGDSGLQIIRIQDLTGNTYTTNFYNGQYKEKYKVRDGDVLISWSASLGVYEWCKGDALLNQHIFKVVFDKIKVDKKYFMFAVNFLLKEIGKETHGSTMKHITKPRFDNTQFPLPPLDEQKRIAQNLDLASEIVKGYKEQLTELDKLVQSVFYDMFGDPVDNLMKWDKVSLGEACIKITDGKHGGCNFEEDSGYYFVGAREIRNGQICYDTAPQITKEHFEKSYRRCNLEKGDLVLVNTGATIGKSAIARSDLSEKTLLQKSVALFKTDINVLLPVFLQCCYTLNSEMYRVKNASAQPNLLLSKIKETKIILPHLPLQTHFASIVTDIEAQKAKIQHALTEAENLFNSLMQEYFE